MEQTTIKKVSNTLEALANKHDAKALATALELLVKLFGNIANQPQELKYRKIKVTNGTLANKVFSVNGIDQILLDLGFVFDGSEFWTLNGSDVTDIGNSVILINARMTILNNSNPDSEAVRRRQAEWNNKFSEEEERKKALLESMKNDRKDKKKDCELNPAKDSVGNNLKFGRQQKNMEDICPQINQQKGG